MKYYVTLKNAETGTREPVAVFDTRRRAANWAREFNRQAKAAGTPAKAGSPVPDITGKFNKQK